MVGMRIGAVMRMAVIVMIGLLGAKIWKENGVDFGNPINLVPVAAGIGEMSYRKFVKYNIIGVISWGIGIMLLGYFLGQIEFVKHNVEYFTIFFVIVSTIPIALEAWRARKHQKHEEARAEREEAKPAE